MIYIYITNFINFIVCATLYDNYLHIYQLKDYKNKRYFKYFIKKIYIFAIFIVFFVLFLINYLFFNNNLIFNINLNLILIFINTIYSFYLIRSDKTPLNYTTRAKHLYIISMILLLIINSFPQGVIITCFTLPLIPVIANSINLIDKVKNNRYIRKAKLKLSLNKTKVIAITGSNGKTSVKNILYSILSTKYNTQMTPKSYNTELGISKFINEELQDNCQYLILEYGARNKGDITKLCKLFGADYGIVTNVAPQHLETFHSIENVYKAKSELPSYLNGDLCVFNLDNEYTRIMYNNKLGKKLSVSTEQPADIRANNIVIKDCQTKFNIIFKDQSYPVSTRLLGKHNVTNILLSSLLALNLDISIEDIIITIANLQPIPHRLELIKTDINILDDSYNCSLASAKEAILTLLKFPKAHAVATPGIIEGGKEQYSINFQLGRMLADCDIVILIGKTNLNALSSGLKANNFSKTLIIANDLETAKTYFSKLKKGDSLLLLNDLPDDYN